VAKKRKPDQSEKVEPVTYLVFFRNCLAQQLVKPWQQREIYVFFKDLGLSDKEPENKYIDALAKY
jgi:hypothetical protein